MTRIKSKGKVWLWSTDKAAWHFLTLTKQATQTIKKLTDGKRRGWGSVKVSATVGKTTWETSVFPDKDKGFILPLKAKVRKAESIENSDTIEVTLLLI